MDGRGSHGTSCLQTCFTPSKSLLKAHLSCQTLQRSRPDAGGQQGFRQTVHTFEKPIKTKECKRRAPARNKISERRDCWKQRSCGCKGLRCCSFDCERKVVVTHERCSAQARVCSECRPNSHHHIMTHPLPRLLKLSKNVSVRGFSGFMVCSEWFLKCQQPSLPRPWYYNVITVQGRHSAP